MDAKKMIDGMKQGLGVIPFFVGIIFTVVLLLFVLLFALGALQDAGTSSGYSANILSAMDDVINNTISLVDTIFSPLTIAVSLLIVVVIIAIFGWMLYQSGGKGKNKNSGMGGY